MAKLIGNWKNKVEKDGIISMDLVIVDEDNQILPTTISKSWDATLVNDRFLTVQANEEMIKLITKFKAQELQFAMLASLSDEQKDSILMKWVKSLPQEQQNQILLNGMGA